MQPNRKPPKETEEQLKAYIGATSDIVFEMSANWQEMVLLRGKHFIASFENPSRDWMDFYIPAEEQQRVWDAVQAAIDTKGIFELEHRVWLVDGSVGWMFSRAIPLLDDDGTIVKWFGAANNITDRKRAEEALAKSEEKYHSLFESMDEGVVHLKVFYDKDGAVMDMAYLDYNPAFEKQTGLTIEVLGKRASEMFPKQDKSRFAIFGRVAKTGIPEREVRYSPVIERWMDVYVAPVMKSNKNEVFCVFKDITERKRREASMGLLNEISQQLIYLTSVAATMDTLGAKICTHFGSSRCVFTEINEATEEAVVESDWRQPGLVSLVGTYRISEYFNEEFLRTMRAGQPFVVHDRDADPRVEAKKLAGLGVASIVAIPILRNGELKFAISINDVTARTWREDEIDLMREITTRVWTQLERVRADEALTKSEEKYRTLFNSIDEGFCTIEVLFDENDHPFDYRFLETNPAFVKHTGLVDAIGKTVLEFAPEHEQFWFDIYGKIARKGRPKRFEHRAEALNRWYDVFAFRIGEPNENKVAVLFNDIAERKLAEDTLRQFTTRLEEEVSERTSELKETNRELQSTITQLESFNHIASHDLQEPLRKIQVFVSRMQDNHNDADKQQQYLSAIGVASQRMRELIDDLLVFSRLSNKQDTFKTTDLNLILNQVLLEYEEFISEKQAMIDSEPLPTMEVIPFQIRLLFANLISNALKFCERVPEIRITYKLVPASALQPTFPVKDYDEFAEITFADNGIGFDNQYSRKIFGLFQRLTPRKEFKGTGIGLSIVEKVVKDHSGFVRAAGVPGEGAVFSIYLPFRS